MLSGIEIVAGFSAIGFIVIAFFYVRLSLEMLGLRKRVDLSASLPWDLMYLKGFKCHDPGVCGNNAGFCNSCWARIFAERTLKKMGVHPPRGGKNDG